MEGRNTDLFPNADRARAYGTTRQQDHSSGVDSVGTSLSMSPTPSGSKGNAAPSSSARTSVPNDVHEGGGGAAAGGRAAGHEWQDPLPPPPVAVFGAAEAATRRQAATDETIDAAQDSDDQRHTAPVTRTSGVRLPASRGWRGRANRLGLTLPASDDELRFRRDQARVLAAFSDTQSVVVANPKGGAGKTPTALMLAATFGHYRGGYTLAWDNNETRGTLGLRAEGGVGGGQGNVIDLLGQIDYFLSTAASVGRLGAFVRPQSAYFDVLASDETPGGMDMVDDAAYAKLREALGRFYRLLVVDTGNNVRARNWFAAVRAANCLVVPTTVQADVASTGLWMLDHLHRVGGVGVVRNAVAVVTCADPHVDKRLVQQIVAEYQRVVRAVVVVPFDRAIRPGTRLSYRDLGEPTRRAYLAAAVAVIDSLAATQPALHGGGNR